MKKSTRNVLLVSFICIIAGIVISCIAVAFGAVDTVVTTAGNGVFNRVFDFEFDDWGEITGTSIEQRDGDVILENADNIPTNLKLSVGGAEVRIEESPDEHFYLSKRGNCRLSYYVEDDTLYIKSENKRMLGSAKIILKVPENTIFSEATVELGAGVLENDVAIVTDELEIEMGAGKIVLENIQIGKGDFEMGAGELVLKDTQIDEMNAEIAMGDFRYEGKLHEKANVECAMGNVDLKIDGNEEDYHGIIECSAGNVSYGNQMSAGIIEKEINPDAAKTIDLSCSMGNVTVDFE